MVDLDGTLLRTDALHEGLATLLRTRPLRLLACAARLCDGKAAFKSAVAGEIDLPPELPLNGSVLACIAEARAAGRQVVLATATHRRWAEPLAQKLGCFDAVLASDDQRNLKGQRKLAAIEAYCRQQGDRDFDYIGDCWADLPIWRAAQNRLAVAPDAKLQAALREFCEPTLLPGGGPTRARAALRLLRPHQWAKNLLLFVPLITSHRLFEPGLTTTALLASVSFSLAASAVYVLNDLADVAADRRHPEKHRRPFAAGDVPLVWGPPLVLLLVVAAIGAALPLPSSFLAGLGVYAATTTAYSLALKRAPVLDVIILACLYAMRVFCGGLATGVVVSSWLLTFSLFIFTSLAFAKRYAELARQTDEGGAAQANGRGYEPSDLPLVQSLGTASGLLAVLVLALYLQSDQMRKLYANELPLWLLCPLLLYWIGRLWRLAQRRQLNEDPVVFALTDPVSWATAILAAVLLACGAGR